MRHARLLLLLPLSFGLSAPAHATAGFAETHSELRYGRHAALHWVHPGDGCSDGSYCFEVRHTDPAQGGFRGLERSLLQINAPPLDAPPLIIAQTCGDEHWIVYDLAQEDYLVDTPSYEEALGAWAASGQREPRFADARHGAHGLAQTRCSLVEGVAWTGLMFLPLLLMLAVPISIVAAFVALIRYWMRRQIRLTR